MRHFLHLLILVFLSVSPIYSAQSDEEFIDPHIIEMAPFVVYGGLIDTIDGFTEEEYHEDDPVVLGFREDFNKILLKFHKNLLIDEHKYMTKTLEIEAAFHADLNSLGQTFGVKNVAKKKNVFIRERSITNRLVKDPFFIIDALIVWDADRLERYTERRPDSKYAKNIRYNPETEKWERRVTTEWNVYFHREDVNSTGSAYKEQGLNLDTNKGFHLVEKGLPEDVPPHAFKKVNLTYPIFVNSIEPADIQIKRLQKSLVANLYQIYDPYSWVLRRSTRLRVRAKYQDDFRQVVKKSRLPVTDRDWFDIVLSNFILDIVTIKHVGVQELYDYEMLMKIPIRENILGIGFDLLNWNPGENRSIDYDPTVNNNFWVNFDNDGYGARFVMVDAYRRYGIQVLDLIRAELNSLAAQKEKMSGKELVKKVLSQMTGTDANKYIKLAEKAQKQELEKYRYQLR